MQQIQYKLSYCWSDGGGCAARLCCGGPRGCAVGKIHSGGEKTSPEHKLSVQSWCSFFCNAAYSSTLHKSSLNLSLTCGQAHGSSPVLGWGSFRTKKVPSFWFSWPGGTVLLGSSFTDEPDERGVVTAATARVALPTYIFCHRPWKEYVIGVNSCCRVTVVLQQAVWEAQAGGLPPPCPDFIHREVPVEVSGEATSSVRKWTREFT